jgi:hypothetical protein
MQNQKRARVRTCVQFRLRESKVGNQHEQELNRERSKEYRHPALIVVLARPKTLHGCGGRRRKRKREPCLPSRSWRDFVTGNAVSGGSGGAVLSRPARKLAGLDCVNRNLPLLPARAGGRGAEMGQ